MSALLKKVASTYTNIWKHAEPQVETYFLMDSPLWLLLIMSAYFSFIFKIGPLIMKNRQAMKLNSLIIIYNWVQIIINAYIFVMALYELPKMNLFCTPPEKSYSPVAIRIGHLQHLYFLLKVLDLLDTVFFVLRKKQNQITFLHVYHHTMMCLAGWLTFKFLLLGQVYFLGLVNVFVHVVMYFYYFLTAWKPEYKNNIWWKKYITQLQIIQHSFLTLAFTLPLFNQHCSHPKLPLAMFLTQSVFMLYLFVNFYKKAYATKEKKIL